jgi:tRNA 2-thiouridine synthesizing protein A
VSHNEEIRKASRVLDCIGMYCPVPVMRTSEEMEKLSIGETLEVLADDSAAEPDIQAWAKRRGQKILAIERTGEGLRITIERMQ